MTKAVEPGENTEPDEEEFEDPYQRGQGVSIARLMSGVLLIIIASLLIGQGLAYFPRSSVTDLIVGSSIIFMSLYFMWITRSGPFKHHK